MISRVEYKASLLAGEDDKVKIRIYKIILRAARYVRVNYCFRESITRTKESIGWKKPYEYIEEASARFMHNVIFNDNPKSLSNRLGNQD